MVLQQREMAEEAIPSTPRIREVRIESESEDFNPQSTRRGGLRAKLHISPTFESVLDGRKSYSVPFKMGHNYDDVGGFGFDIRRLEEKAVELEKDLIIKELETLDFLEALGTTKKILKDLKHQRHQQALRCMESPEHLRSHIKEMNGEHCHRNPLGSPMEMNQVKRSLGKTMDDLAMIQSSVESLNMETKKVKDLTGVVSLAEELNSLRLTPAGPNQGERFNTENIPENPQYEQVKMVTEINDTTFYKQNKTCLKTAEMRLVAARKLEEAARASEALAIAEMTILSSGINQDGHCFLEPPRSPLTLQALMKEDLSTDISRVEITRKLEEANEEVKQSKQALETALQRVELARVKQLEAEEAFRQWNIESWKDQKATRTKRSIRNMNQHKPLMDVPKPMLKRNVSLRNVLNRKIDEKQVATRQRKFRFIHIKPPETE